MRRAALFLALITAAVAIGPLAHADEPQSSYQRKGRGRPDVAGVYKSRLAAHWLPEGNRFWYRNDLKGGAKEFVLVDARTGKKSPAFDHARLAESLSKETESRYTGDRLPFNAVDYIRDGNAIRFQDRGTTWVCDLSRYKCSRVGSAPMPRPKRITTAAGPGSRVEPPRVNEFNTTRRRWWHPLFRDDPLPSPDGKWTAVIKAENVCLQDASQNETRLTTDGRPGLGYWLASWSPDSKTLVAWRIKPGDEKEVYLVESSPRGGGRAKLHKRSYALPGDKFTAYELQLFDAATGKAIACPADRVDFGMPQVRWSDDGHTFTYQQVDRGHQRFRLIEVDARTGKRCNLIDEKSDTFIWTAHTESAGVPLVTWLEKTNELIYSSERDGWRHLYLIDAEAGSIKNPITKGEYVVRGIDFIDEENRQVWFRAGGKNPDQDPYFIHHYRVNFDGSGLVALTGGNGDHSVQFSPDRKYLIDTYSRVDLAPVHELRRASDGQLIRKLEEADISELKANGWAPPEVFVARGRDDKTDIWGIICRPRGFDPAKKYPVIEQIYAGPQGSFVPKTFSPRRRYSDLADLGFIVVQIDGMGTANRSKAFHDVCWKNLKDAGLPDRIRWHQAAAKKYPHYDISRVGIYGGSAGGQNATAALLFHGDFYKAAVSGCGCHDNRLDKASWNEQWMGYPVGPQYAASSNIEHANQLTGKLMLIVGEMDNNVPTESTYRLCDALIKAGKDFDFVMVPGAGHGMGGVYGQRRLQDFFVRHLLGTEPPDRNAPRVFAEAPEKASEPPATQKETKPEPLDLPALVSKPRSEAGVVAHRYEADRGSLMRTYVVPFSATRTARLRKFYTDWLTALKAVDPDQLSPACREDLVELRARIESERKELEARAAADATIAPLVPFAGVIVSLDESRRRMELVDPVKAAATVSELATRIKATRTEIEAGIESGKLSANRKLAARAADAAEKLQQSLKSWHRFRDGYDPLFTWWLAEPYKQADAALEEYIKMLREQGAKLPEKDTASAKDAPPTEAVTKSDGPSDAPDLTELLKQPRSRLIPVVEQYLGGVSRRGRGGSRSGRMEREPAKWLEALKKLDFDKLGRDGQIDYILFRTHLERDLQRQKLREKGIERPAAPKDDSGIVGRPLGREALQVELDAEMIPYTPDELIALARQELDWCEAELKKAAREMGYGDDWRKAVEKVKTLHVQPGQQPKLIRELSDEAVAYLRKNELVTIPPLAAETWRMAMMTPERQLLNPFFTGGEVITVSFPTNTMTHDAKLQSLRGNNVHFARATVHHELIPGHHLQGFMAAREKPYRGLFSTPFWTEGNAVYWEMVLYDRGFPKSPEDRIGFLVWRTHRCCRVIFSLSYHLGRMTPRECIDLLVDRVGFEPDNATAEVRRSFAGAYGPLYQAAYLVGAMQFRALRKELVDTGKMTERDFHDALLKANRIPIELIRADLTGQELTRDYQAKWRFGGDPKTP